MNLTTLALRSLRFHWRSSLGVLLGATLGAAILVGALAVGDSVRYSLRQMALARLGGVHLALSSQSRFFRAELADNLATEIQAPTAATLLLRGTASVQADGRDEIRVGKVQVVGVSDSFWKLGGVSASPFPANANLEGVVLNERLAAKLDAKVGTEVLLRVDKPSLLSRDAPLSTIEDAYITLRVPVAAIVNEAQFGRFSLEANQVPPLNAFLPLSLLQQKIGQPGHANLLLVGAKDGKTPSPSDATQSLWKHWQFADSGLDFHEVRRNTASLAPASLEIRTDRVFLEPAVSEAARKAAPGTQGILTYFVNELRVGNRSTPYSTVAAMEGGVVPPAMKADEILLNQWLADDLQAKAGDEVELKYWLMGPMRRLEEHTSKFRVRGILPLSGSALDPDLMPNIPGLSDKKNCREWEPGVPIDLKKLRDKDQGYWDKYRGTPKAFLSLQAGQQIWNNRFGNLTAVRFPGSEKGRANLEMCIRQALSPTSLGLFFVSVREQALAASSQSLDFGQLFLGFSFFLIAAALILTALLFGFGVEQRAEEVGVLLAVGIPPGKVRRLLRLEGAVLAAIASLLGALIAAFYTRAVIRGLSTVWSGAVAGSELRFHVEPATLAIGAVASFLVALFTVWLVTRRQGRIPARALLSAGAEATVEPTRPAKRSKRPAGLITAIVCGVGALALIGTALAGKKEAAAESFFSAGGLLLIAGIATSRLFLERLERGATQAQGFTVGTLGLRNSARRIGRSLSAIGLLACGSFLVISVGASKHDASEGAEKRDSGTGGFLLYAESTLPVFQDLNSTEGLDTYGLETPDLQGASFVPFRLRQGDEASCLNLNRAQTPNLLGVAPENLANRKAFAFAGTIPGGEKDPWALLDKPQNDNAVPAIGDTNTVVWSLGKSLGATLPYTDERGNTFQIRIVGVMANSVMQGGLIISEANFTAKFPSLSGYSVFLIDRPANNAAVNTPELMKSLTRGMESVGLDLTPTTERLAAFNTVENTYLSIFAVLGGLGLLLGSLGLGVVVLRNVLERRSELALLRSIGFRSGTLHWLVFSEHTLLLLLGLAVGVVSALIAILPVLQTPGANVPVVSLSLTLLAVLATGFLWTYAATTLALRGPLLTALRNE